MMHARDQLRKMRIWFTMAFMKKKILTFCMFFSIIFCLHAEKNSDEIDFWTEMPHESLAHAIVEKMNDEELLSQILMFGWAGEDPSDLLNSWVTMRGLGSVKVFGWNTNNIQKVAKSVRVLQQRAANRKFKIPLFVATDQEGGWIRHVKGETSDTPGNMAIGAGGYPIDSYYSGFYINREIRALGINMNFAPTVDLYTNLESTVIGPRSFGSDPDHTGVLGEAFARGSEDAGVIPTAKHFPGHGDTSLDSHGKLPEINIDEETLEKRELVPFNYLIKSRIPAIMSGHLSFPQIEPDGTPASLSKKFLTEILRKKLGYKGLIITDDMMMNGATIFAGSFANAVTLAIEAGNDIIISSTTANLNENMWTRNIAKMKSDDFFRNRVKESAFRVILAKLEYFKSENHAPLYPDENTIYEYIPDKEGQKFFLEQACRSVSLYQKGSSFPLNSKNAGKVLVAGPYLSMYNEVKKRFPDCTKFYISHELMDDDSNYDSWNAAGLANAALEYDTIIICVYDKHTSRIAKRLKNLDKSVVILSIMSPVHVLSGFEWADTILCGYSYSSYSFAALLGALCGDYEPVGRIPLGDGSEF